MADDNAAAPAGASPAAGAAPSFNLVGQYIRDLSFENPGAPGSNMSGGANPNFNVSINVSVKKQNDEHYAVECCSQPRSSGTRMCVHVELDMARVPPKNGPRRSCRLMVECPRLIFPFARQVLANTVQNGGFPPLMMEPVDFQALYIQNLRNLQAQQQKTGDAPSSPISDRLKN